MIGLSFPLSASASILSSLSRTAEAETTTTSSNLNSQKVGLSQSTIGPGSLGSPKSQVEVLSTATTLSPQMGPLGSAADVAEMPLVGDITLYTVHAGDTPSSVAKMFGVTKATILAANDLTNTSKLKEGQTLVILPIAGHLHTVTKGDTLLSIAKKYKVDAGDIAFYNDLPDDASLSIGMSIIIPDADFDTIASSSQTSSKPSSENTTSKISKLDPSKPDFGNFILRPVDINQSIRTQGAHGWNKSGVDIGAKTGTPVVAAHDGMVMLAKTGGWNGGYGNYIIIMTEYNGRKIQTVYGHLSKVLVNSGDMVSRGDLIGLVGSTGNSTGSHLHFEVRGILNPLTINKNYTGR